MQHHRLFTNLPPLLFDPAALIRPPRSYHQNSVGRWWLYQLTGFHCSRRNAWSLVLNVINYLVPLKSGECFTANSFCCLQYYCTSLEHETQSMITQAKILSGDFNSVGLTGECPAQHALKGLRYAWYTKPCEFKKCAVYSIENELPGPPFTWNAPVNWVTQWLRLISVDGDLCLNEWKPF